MVIFHILAAKTHNRTCFNYGKFSTWNAVIFDYIFFDIDVWHVQEAYGHECECLITSGREKFEQILSIHPFWTWALKDDIKISKLLNKKTFLW